MSVRAIVTASNIESDNAEVCLRPAAAHELRAARLLLSELARVDQVEMAFVATAGAKGRIIGASARAMLPRDRIEGRCPAEVGIAPAFRGHGTEAELWRCLIEEARAAGLGLVSQGWFDPADSPPAESLKVVQHRYEFLMPVGPATAAIEAIHARRIARGRVPAGARVVALREVEPDAVIDLFRRFFPGDPDELLNAMRGKSPDAFHPDFSTVTLLGDQVTGFMIGQLLPRESLFDILWKAVDPAHRNSWSNVWLMWLNGVRLRAAGVQWVRYRALTHNQDTRQVFEHLGGQQARVDVRWGCDASESNQPAGARRCLPPGVTA